ncbi:fluoride efflux transporter FluC [Lactobacillus terrae]|uniref:fluoride efflux transporter FluC n=1 Tax=Lactobacillus terrae TaxID=2269374 RepID=UPI000C1B6E55|nr:CrcB family protein [Lactobacillus terrae]
MTKLQKFIYIMIAAFVGGNLRYALGFLPEPAGTFPIGTIIANLSGAFLLPIVVIYVQYQFHIDSDHIKIISSGLLGAYTTFSTFTKDSVMLYLNHQFLSLTIYLLLTIIGGFLLAELSVVLSTKLIAK